MTPLRIGLISDTHGLLRPQALQALRGADHIVHAGDIGGPQILDALRQIAPLTVVRGNNDAGDWADALPLVATLRAGGFRLQVVHDMKDWPGAAGSEVHAVIAGHSHRPRIETIDGVLHVNPGSAGPRRFTLPISMGELMIEAGQLHARLFDLPA